VADADKPSGQEMQQEPAQEFIDRQGHRFLLIVVRGVPPSKGDLVILEETSRWLEMATRCV
jgi:hypothetical protein